VLSAAHGQRGNPVRNHAAVECKAEFATAPSLRRQLMNLETAPGTKSLKQETAKTGHVQISLLSVSSAVVQTCSVITASCSETILRTLAINITTDVLLNFLSLMSESGK